MNWAEVVAEFARAVKQALDWLRGDFGTIYWGGQTILVNSATPQHLDLPNDAIYDILVINDGPDAVDVRFPDDTSAGWIQINSGENAGVGGPRRSSASTGALRINGVLTTGATLRLQYAWIGKPNG